MPQLVLKSTELSIIDLGCAREAREGHEAHGLVGAVSYRAPEVTLGIVSLLLKSSVC